MYVCMYVSTVRIILRLKLDPMQAGKVVSWRFIHNYLKGHEQHYAHHDLLAQLWPARFIDHQLST
jgi:hypothetical protein